LFGYVTASFQELSKEERRRYGAVYCGICRAIGQRSGQIARMNLSYDMAFLALLLMSLYEPDEEGGSARCALHPLKKRPWVDNPHVRYAADMNIALAYYKCLDDWQDDGSHRARWMAGELEPHVAAIRTQWPRQCAAIETCIHQLSQLEAANCANPDEPAGCFGQLMAQLLVYEEDFWTQHLQEMGMALGRFIYLADAAADLSADLRKKKYNPCLAAGILDPQQHRQHLLLAMGRCTHYFEKLPLVQDKPLLNNILYSGVWTLFPKNRKEATQK
jgi:hypothetical protein